MAPGGAGVFFGIVGLPGEGDVLKRAMTLDDCRLFYADEIRVLTGIDSAALVAAYARVPREKFLGPAPW